jgi:hypothetical protein
MTTIGYVADVYALLSIPVIIYQWCRSRKNKKIYEQLLLKIYAEKGKDIYLSISRKTKNKWNWYLGSEGEKVLGPVRALFINNTQVVPLLSKDLRQKHEEINRKINNVNEVTNYPLLATELLNYFSDIMIYVSKELKIHD